MSINYQILLSGEKGLAVGRTMWVKVPSKHNVLQTQSMKQKYICDCVLGGVCVCMRVCMCVRKRQKEAERDRERESGHNLGMMFEDQGFFIIII